MRLVFMGTPDFAVPSLQALVNSDHEILGVVTRPDRPRGRGQKPMAPPVKTAARAAGLPVRQPLSNNELLMDLQYWRPEIAVVVAFGLILSQSILELPVKGCINLHASLLPRYRGAAPIHRAVMNGEKETGVTTMWVTPKMDSGDIILQKRLPIPYTANVGQIHDRLAVIGAELLVYTLDLVAANKAPRQPQDEALVTYAPMLKSEEEKIVWEQPAEVIYNHIRGLNPWPGAYTRREGGRLKVYAARIVDRLTTGVPGQVVSITDEGFTVQTGKGQILITEVQPSGKKIMPASAYLQGYPVVVGEVLVCV